MFQHNRYMTKGVSLEIPAELQFFLWSCIDRLPAECDSFQIFKLSPIGPMQRISHNAEQPEYHKEYLIPALSPIAAKIYVIDSGSYSTMLLADEY